MKSLYRTHTGLWLELAGEHGRFSVKLTGDMNVQVQVLYEGDDAGKARRIYRYWRNHYQERKRQEATSAP